MKKHTIPAHEVTNLVKTTTEAFEVLRDAKRYNQLKPKDMHFMADLLVELVETAYPLDREVPEDFTPKPHEVRTILLKKGPSKKFDSIEELFESLNPSMDKFIDHCKKQCGECEGGEDK